MMIMLLAHKLYFTALKYVTSQMCEVSKIFEACARWPTAVIVLQNKKIYI